MIEIIVGRCELKKMEDDEDGNYNISNSIQIDDGNLLLSNYICCSSIVYILLSFE